MKEKYEKTDVNIVVFDNDDVVTASDLGDSFDLEPDKIHY